MTAGIVPIGTAATVRRPDKEGRGARIAFVSNTCFGLYQFRLWVMEALRERGYEVYAVAGEDGYTASLIARGFHVELVPISQHGTRLGDEVRLLSALDRTYRRLAFDFVFHYTIKPNIYGSLVARRLGIPNVAVVTGLGSFLDVRPAIKAAVTHQAYRLGARAASEVWFLNHADADYFRERGYLRGTRYRLIPGEGIDLAHYAPPPGEGLSGRRTPRVALYAGRLLRAKGIYELAEAGRILRRAGVPIAIRVLGRISREDPDSIDIAQLERWTKSGCFEYLGDTADVRPYILNADCVVLPTHREGLSRVLLEAMALARPIVTTTVAGAQELVRGGSNGILVPPRNAAALAEALTEISSISEERLTAMGREGRRRAGRDFSTDKVMDAYLQVLERLPTFQPTGARDRHGQA